MCVTPININGQLSILGKVKKSISIMMLEQNYDPATDLIHRAKSRIENAKNPKFGISGKCLP